MLHVICHQGMQIKTTTWYHYIPIRMSKIPKEDEEQQQLSFIPDGMQNDTATLKESLTGFSLN